MSATDSMYDPICDRLKKDKQVRITAKRLLHPRIIKAVTKRKWLDVGFKLEIEPAIAIMSTSRKHAILTFHLEIKKYNYDFRTRKPLTTEDI